MINAIRKAIRYRWQLAQSRILDRVLNRPPDWIGNWQGDREYCAAFCPLEPADRYRCKLER